MWPISYCVVVGNRLKSSRKVSQCSLPCYLVMAAPAATEVVVPKTTFECCQCHEEQALSEQVSWTRNDKVYLRCKDCSYWPRRLKAQLSKLMPEDKDVFDSLSEASRSEFMHKHRAVLGDSLKKAVDNFVERSQLKTKQTKFKGKGLFYDIEDLTKLYENKPDQLAHIVANARTIDCTTRGVTLYELPSYTLSDITSTTDSTNRSLSGSSKDVVKHKNPKALVQVKVGNLSATQSAKLNKVEGKLAIASAELTVSLTRAATPPYDAFVPEKIIEKAALAVSAADAALATCLLAKADTWTGDIELIMVELFGSLDMVQSYGKRLRLFFDSADEMEEKPEGTEGEDETKADTKPAATLSEPAKKRLRCSLKKAQK
jgi:hypothetical protein